MAASVDGFKWKEIKERTEAERAKYGGKTREEILAEFLSSGMADKKAVDVACELEDLLSSGMPYNQALAAVWEKLDTYKEKVKSKNLNNY